MKHLQHHLLQAHALAQPAQADAFEQLVHLRRDRAEAVGDLRRELLQFLLVLDVVQPAVEREAFGRLAHVAVGDQHGEVGLDDAVVALVAA